MSSRPSRGAARLAAILDALPDALVLVNANGTVVNANTIALEAFETPGTALVGRGLLDLLPQFDSRLIPGSMRRPDHIDPRARTKPTRMVARRTDGTEFPVEVTSANLETGQQAYDTYGYTGDELLMLVVRDLSGTVDTEAELARSQRQTEMILRAASEGVVGTDTDGRIVLVNPAAAQILGYRAGELGGRELHTLVLHSRADGSPFPYDESPLADTLRSGRKHRVRGQVVFAKSGDQLPVDLTTAPVRDGDQLVGAVMTFTDRRPYDALVKEHEEAEQRHAEELERLAEEHASELTELRQRHVAELEELKEQHAEEIAADADRYAALGEREKDRYEAIAGRHEQLLTLLGDSLRGPLDELRRELAALASDDAGQLWPEANQVLHHLSAGYSRITTLIDNVLGYQRLDIGNERVARTKVMLDAVVAAGVDGAVELIGPGRVQFAVHAPPIEAEVDARLLATALAHLVADVAGVDATGNSPVSATGGYLDNTVVVAAAQRGEVVRIEVRGPYAGGDPVHEPIVRGIVRAHGGVLQTHEVPGMSGSAYVLEVPIGGGAGAVAGTEAAAVAPVVPDARADAAGAAGAGNAVAVREPAPGGGRRRARRASVDAFLESEVAGAQGEAGPEAENTAPTGRRRRRAAQEAEPQAAPAQGQVQAQGQTAGASAPLPVPAQAVPGEGAGAGGTGRRRGRPAEGPGAEAAGAPQGAPAGVSEGAVVMAGEHGGGSAASNTGLGGTVPPQGVPVPSGRRGGQDGGEQHALPPALPAQAGEPDPANTADTADADRPTGRRRRALASANERAAAQEAAPRQVFALPPADADRPSEGTAETETELEAGTRSRTRTQAHVPGQAHAPGQAQGQVPGQGQAGRVPVPGPAVPGDALPDDGRHDAVPHGQDDDHTPPQPHPAEAPTGRRRRAGAARPAEGPAPVQAQNSPREACRCKGRRRRCTELPCPPPPRHRCPSRPTPAPTSRGRTPHRPLPRPGRPPRRSRGPRPGTPRAPASPYRPARPPDPRPRHPPPPPRPLRASPPPRRAGAPRCRPRTRPPRARRSRCPPRRPRPSTRTRRRDARSACAPWARACRSTGRRSRCNSRRPHPPRTSRAVAAGAASWARRPTRPPPGRRSRPGRTRPPSSRRVPSRRSSPRPRPSRSPRSSRPWPAVRDGRRRSPRAPDGRTP